MEDDGKDEIQNGKCDVNDKAGDQEQNEASGGFLGFMGAIYQTVKTQIAPRAMEFVSTQVAPRALYIMKTLLQDVPLDVYYSDSDDDWQDCKLEESDDSEKGSEGEQSKDVNEQAKVKQRTQKVTNTDVANSMFKDIEVIHQFHKENLLPQLQHRLENWEKFRCIGDIMRKLTPFLKLYTEYVKNFEIATTLVESWEEKSSTFSKLLKEVREDKKTGRLRLQAHMLEPIQRVPRYELLLSDYLKRLPDGSPDKEDTTRALEQVSEAAKHFEEMMKRDSRILKLVELQNQFEGSIRIVNSTRELIKQGKVKTISAKNNKSVDRMCFLFNDLLLVADRNASRLSTKYKVKHIIDITNAQLADGNNIDIPHTFYIKTKDRVIEICLKDEEGKREWEKAIVQQIGNCTKQRLLRSGSVRVKNVQNERRTLGRRAPVLIHQNSISTCMICNSSFGTLKKKKHCRACGHVICTKCSSHCCYLHYDLSKPQRICDECFVILEGESEEFSKRGKKNGVEGECLEKGYLQLSGDGGKTWKRRWFSLHDNLTLYSFRNVQDTEPLTSMSLGGYSVSIEVSLIKRGTCIRLQGMGKIYFLYDEDSTTIQRWYDTVTQQVQKRARDLAASFRPKEALTSSNENRLKVTEEETTETENYDATVQTSRFYVNL
ncbi:hypothetical protein LSH36_491g02035 [Paralvinella palmiformis]|uniref:Uncharacterized protein n=1 Tax=Paralvinella palmiformis TaxID=53620 RepID=A0AAD9J8R9_9ANNE|nr:hypothetical protein LSH36_491g02035 [Paralvinella palmiformis]